MRPVSRRKRTRELALYASNQFLLGEKLSLRAGLRLTLWQNVGPSTEYYVVPSDDELVEDSLAVVSHPEGEVYHSYWSLDPRLSLVWKPGGRHLLKTSYSRTSQFQYLIQRVANIDNGNFQCVVQTL